MFQLLVQECVTLLHPRLSLRLLLLPLRPESEVVVTVAALLVVLVAVTLAEGVALVTVVVSEGAIQVIVVALVVLTVLAQHVQRLVEGMTNQNLTEITKDCYKT